MSVETLSIEKPPAGLSLLAQYRALLGRYLLPQWQRVLLMAVLLLAGIALQLANPQVIRYFLDTAQAGGTSQLLLRAALLFIFFALLQQGMALAASYTSRLVSWAATNRLRTDLALHCLRLDMTFHKRRTPGEMIERVDGDVSQLAGFLAQMVVEALGNGLLVLGILALLLREDLLVGAGLAVYTLLVFAALGAIQQLAVRRWAAARQAAAEQYGFIEERISGAEELRINAAEDFTLRRMLRLAANLIRKDRAGFVAGSLAYNLTNLLYVAGYALGLGLGVWLYTQGQATLGAAYLIVHYVGMLSEPLQRIRAQAEDLQQATASIQRIQELLALQPAVGPAPVTGSALPAGPLGVTFADVSFHYEEAEGDVLKQVDFALAPGRVLGILGRTGSGKSTLTRLLFRLYDPSAGSIRLVGNDPVANDLPGLPLSELRRRVGLVTQDVQLFQASVRDNLTFFDAGIPDEKLERILRSLGLWEWVAALPAGLNTPLGSGGQGLSAGEAQLLAFARVFLKDPGLIILDEASSRLDPATEARMERAIDHLFAGRTGIVIAHRLKTVQRADDILILEGGRVVEFGPRAALAADPSSRFSRLLQAGLEEVLA